MARNKDVDEVETVDVDEVAPDTETSEKPAKAKKEPVRGELPEGYVTPVGLAKVIEERKLHTAKDGSHEVKPQMVYSYIKNAAKEDPFPLTEVQDSLGHARKVVLVEDGVAWWERKNERTATRRANAKEKADKKAAKATEAPAEDTASEPVVEAE
jgi:hypothetical protein